MDMNKKHRIPKPSGANKKYTFFIGGFLSLLGFALYQVIISPIINPEPWKEIRAKLYDQLPKSEKDN